MTSDQDMGYTGESTAGKTASESSIWKIIVGVFTSPSEAFAAYNLKPTILIPLLIGIVLVSATGAMLAGPSANDQYNMMSSGSLPPQALEQMRVAAENPNPITAAIGGPIFITIFSLIGALLAWFIGSFIFGGTAKYKAVWGVGLLAGLITQLGGVIRIPLALAKESMYVSFGLAALFPDKDFTSVVYSLLYYLDGFAIWSIIVCGIGYAAIFQVSRGKGIAIAAITSLILIGVGIGLTAFGMSFAGVELTFF